MKISCFYPENITAAWSCTIGVGDELERMGHSVERVALKPPPARNKIPKLDELRAFDLILLCGMEHFWQVINGAFGESWKKLMITKVAWYHESAFREDRNPITAEVFPWADEHFFPAAQDAEFFDQEHFVQGRAHFLPFGVDEKMFTHHVPVREFEDHGLDCFAKIYDCAFIGGLYPKRQQFLGQLARHLHKDTVLECGNVVMQDLRGSMMREQTALYAQNIRQVKVFVNLPALSQLQTTKIFEVLACGSFILTPAIEGAGAKNMKLFQQNKHLVYYPENRPDYLAAQMKEWTSPENEKKREKIARQGHEEVMAKHTLRYRLEEMFLKLKMDQSKEAMTAT